MSLTFDQFNPDARKAGVDMGSAPNPAQAPDEIPHPGHTCGPESNCDQLCADYATQELRKRPTPFALGPENPIPGPVDWTKPVRTKGGKFPIRVYAIDHSLIQPVVGRIVYDVRSPMASSWQLSGIFGFGGGSDCNDAENYEPEAPAQDKTREAGNG